MREKRKTVCRLMLRLDSASWAKIDNAVKDSVIRGFSKIQVTQELLDKFVKAVPFLTEGRIQAA